MADLQENNTENYINESLEQNTKIDNSPFLKIAEHGRSSRTKALKLKINDVVVAVDGTEFRSTSEDLVDLLSSEEDGKWLLTIFRDGLFFEIFTIGPLGGILKFTTDEETFQISKQFSERPIFEKSEFRTFEVLKNLHKKCDIYDTSFSQIAVILPPVWLLQNRMWEPFIAVMSVYLVTFNVSFILFFISSLIIAIYFKQGQITIRRSYSMFQEYQVWAIIASIDEASVQQICRKFDPKCDFIKSLVGPPVVTEEDKNKKKKKRKSGNVATVSTVTY